MNAGDLIQELKLYKKKSSVIVQFINPGPKAGISLYRIKKVVGREGFVHLILDQKQQK